MKGNARRYWKRQNGKPNRNEMLGVSSPFFFSVCSLMFSPPLHLPPIWLHIYVCSCGICFALFVWWVRLGSWMHIFVVGGYWIVEQVGRASHSSPPPPLVAAVGVIFLDRISKNGYNANWVVTCNNIWRRIFREPYYWMTAALGFFGSVYCCALWTARANLYVLYCYVDDEDMLLMCVVVVCPNSSFGFFALGFASLACSSLFVFFHLPFCCLLLTFWYIIVTWCLSVLFCSPKESCRVRGFDKSVLQDCSTLHHSTIKFFSFGGGAKSLFFEIVSYWINGMALIHRMDAY